MTNFDMDFDYFLLLGIEPSQAMEDPVSAVGQIRAKRKEWTLQAHNPRFQHEAKANLERAREFEPLLQEPAALMAFADHVKQCRIVRVGEHEAELSLWLAFAVEGKKSLSVKQHALIQQEAKAKGIPETLLGEVLRKRGIAVVEAGPKTSVEKPKLPSRSPSLARTVFDDIQNWLKVLGKQSLYELLDAPNVSAPARLVTEAQRLYIYWSKALPKTNAGTAWEKSLQSCITYLKDAESKERYDHALFNHRVQRLVSRIDLVLSGVEFQPADQGRIVRLGVEDFGFSVEVVEQCVASRLAELGLTTQTINKFVIQTGNQVRCRRCAAWNNPNLTHCRECSCSLQRKCENPSCRHAILLVEAKVCPQCGLAILKGVQYRTLLRLVDAFLESGSHQAAVSACQLADQIHPGKAVTDRLAHASRIRLLAANAKTLAASKAWSGLLATWKALLNEAPRGSLAGVPSLEKVSTYLAEAVAKLRAVPADASSVDQAKVYLSCLRQWTDCDEAFQKIRAICQRLLSEQQPRLASQLVGRLRELRPDDPDLSALANQLEPEVQRIETLENERQILMNDYVAAVRDKRYFAAEKHLQALESAKVSGPAPPAVAELRKKLANLRGELSALKQSSLPMDSSNRHLEAYTRLLENCPDCAEALNALATLAVAPPSPPEGLSLQLEGNRRILFWQPGSRRLGRLSFVLQRTIIRQGSRLTDPQFQTIYSGDAHHFIDDEIVHGGAILRYMIHAVDRGEIAVDGRVVRAYESVSSPVAFPVTLVWQEVVNLRSVRKPGALELNWFQPSGARQVLIERRAGGPSDDRSPPTSLLASSDGRLIDLNLEEGHVYTYRLSCLYDGPEGEFRTPGVSLTDGIVAAPDESHIRSVPSNGSLIAETN